MKDKPLRINMKKKNEKKKKKKKQELEFEFELELNIKFWCGKYLNTRVIPWLMHREGERERNASSSGARGGNEKVGPLTKNMCHSHS